MAALHAFGNGVVAGAGLLSSPSGPVFHSDGDGTPAAGAGAGGGGASSASSPFLERKDSMLGGGGATKQLMDSSLTLALAAYDENSASERQKALEQRRIPDPRQIPYSELLIKQEIGRGQFGTVYLATWRGAPVAVKKLHSQNLSPEQLKHFVREAGIMELLGNHPNGTATVPCDHVAALF